MGENIEAKSFYSLKIMNEPNKDFGKSGVYYGDWTNK